MKDAESSPQTTAQGQTRAPNFVEIPIDDAERKHAGVAMGDIDGDGRAEILAGRRDGDEGLFAFTCRQDRWVGGRITDAGDYGGVALADVTGGGVLDLIAVKTAGRPAGLEIHQTQVAEGRVDFRSLPSPFTEAGCDDVAVGDIEGDGDTDIAVSTGGKGLQILLSDGTGSSQRLTLPTDVYEDTGLALGDVNGDGPLDAISANHPGENLRLFLCSPDGPASYGDAHAEGCLARGSATGSPLMT